MTAEQLAELFHTEYERLAPEYGYETRKASAVPWAEVPLENKTLMIAVAQSILDRSEPSRRAIARVLGMYRSAVLCGDHEDESMQREFREAMDLLFPPA
jgi:hypothetical protein